MVDLLHMDQHLAQGTSLFACAPIGLGALAASIGKKGQVDLNGFCARWECSSALLGGV